MLTAAGAIVPKVIMAASSFSWVLLLVRDHAGRHSKGGAMAPSQARGQESAGRMGSADVTPSAPAGEGLALVGVRAASAGRRRQQKLRGAARGAGPEHPTC